MDAQETKARIIEVARNTISAAEFISDTIRAESRYFTGKTYEFLTSKLTGHRFQSTRDASLEPLAGVGTNSSRFRAKSG